MQKEINYFSCHFHKVDCLTWLATRTLLQRVLINRIEAGCDRFVFEVSQDDFQVISNFLFDMDVAYMHPRRDAMHVSLMTSQYSNIQLPARAAIFSRHSADVPRDAENFSANSSRAILENPEDVSRAPRAHFASSKRAIFQGSESFPRAPRASSPANLS